MPSSRPRVIAHRGASGREPENSLAAFRAALALGADGIELDLHATRDGALVVHHDFELPGLGPIDSLTLDRVREHRLPNGESVPLLGEALEAIGRHDVWVEVKALDPAFDEVLFRTLDAGPDPERYAVHAFDHRIIARLAAGRRALHRGVLSSAYPLDPVAPVLAAAATTLWQEHRLIDRQLVDCLHAAGCTVIAWTVNTPEDIARAIALDVDGLCGNYPERIRAALR